MQSLTWYANRIRTMSLAEVFFRAERAFSARAEVLTGPSRVPEPAWDHLKNFAPARVPSVNKDAVGHKAARVTEGIYTIFALQNVDLGSPPQWNVDPLTGTKAPLTHGKLIDYRDPAIVGNIKYLWELSRHLQYPVLAQAYRLTGNTQFVRTLAYQIDHWITQCPFPRGVHWCSSLENGIRLINWAMCWRLVGGVDEWRKAGVEAQMLHRWLDSIYRHMEFIDGYYSAHSSANNHVIGEAAGVFVGAATWPCWPQTDRWQHRAKRILIEQAQTQTWDDGVNKEQALSYQQFVLDFLLISALHGQWTGDEFPAAFWQTIERMLEFIAAVIDSAGNLPMIGDADDGYVFDLASEPAFCNFRSLLATGSLLFDRADFARKARSLDTKTRWLLGDRDDDFEALRQLKACEAAPSSFPDGGYHVIGCDLGREDELLIVFDAGPLGLIPLAAHGHADALSFTLSSRGRPIFIDPGTYAYHTDLKWRNYFRGTGAHNTVRIDGIDQSEIAGNFMWHRHATAAVENRSDNNGVRQITATHDGYLRLPDPVLHRRTLKLREKQRTVEIEDELVCAGAHQVELLFQFPEYAVVRIDDDTVSVTAEPERVSIYTDPRLTLEVLSGQDSPPAGWISYRFDDKVAAFTLRCHMDIKGTTRLTTRIDCA